jgi:hypothetical protein
MVYGPTDDPDAILEAFIQRLVGDGFDALGVLQRRSLGDQGNFGPAEFLVLSEVDWRQDAVDIRRSKEADSGTVLRSASATLSMALKRRPDVLVLNRFGSLESVGSGLLDVLAQAIELDVPVVIAVPEALFAKWLTLAEGLAVKLKPDLLSLDFWWRSLGKTSPSETSGATCCERFK